MADLSEQYMRQGIKNGFLFHINRFGPDDVCFTFFGGGVGARFTVYHTRGRVSTMDFYIHWEICERLSVVKGGKNCFSAFRTKIFVSAAFRG